MNFLDYQEQIINALRDSGRDAIKVSWGYGTDLVRLRLDWLQLVRYTNSKGENVANWVHTQKANGDLVTRVDTYPAEGVRVLTEPGDGKLRELVAPGSRILLEEAVMQNVLLKHQEKGKVSASYWTRSLCVTPPGTPSFYTFDGVETAKFLPANKPALVDKETGGDFLGNYQEVKIGRAVRHVLDAVGIEATDQELERVVNYIKAVNAPVEVKYTEDLEWLYNREDLAQNSGTLLDSCMRGKGWLYRNLQQSGNVRAWYWENENGELLGRALEWTTIRGTKVLDRIYTNDFLLERVKTEAKNAGVIHKTFQSYSDRLAWTNPDGSTEEATFKIECSNLIGAIYDEEVPYMDTFCFYGYEEGTGEGYLSNRRSIVEGEDLETYELRSTDGEAERID